MHRTGDGAAHQSTRVGLSVSRATRRRSEFRFERRRENASRSCLLRTTVYFKACHFTSLYRLERLWTRPLPSHSHTRAKTSADGLMSPG